MQLLGLGWYYNGSAVVSITRNGVMTANGMLVKLDVVNPELCREF
jgi:hypothetical protein